MKQVLSAAAMYGVYGASQGFTALTRISPRIFTERELQSRPWIGYYEHHFWQMAFALILIGILSKGRFADWGLNFRNARLSMRLLWKSMAVYTLIVLAWNVAPSLITGGRPTFPYAVTPGNVVGILSYMGLFAGISEEILFRGLIHTYLARTWQEAWIVRGIAIPSAGLVATCIFCLAHIDSWRINWPQQLFAFGLGLYYSCAYHRTGSLLILAHNFSDVTVSAAGFAVYTLGRGA